jgi:hypothetical protein
MAARGRASGPRGIYGFQHQVSPSPGHGGTRPLLTACSQENTLIDQKIIDLYDKYTHAPLDRRVFLARLAQLTGSTAAAAALVQLLEAKHAAAIIAPDDQRLETGRLSYPGAKGNVTAYLARPKGDAKLPAVIVIHENRGLERRASSSDSLLS